MKTCVKHETFSPNVVLERLALLLRIREVPGLNFGPETGYPDWDSSWFSSVPPDNDRFLPQTFEFITHCHSLIRRHIVWILKASFNEL
jgi:hypothetical protein